MVFELYRFNVLPVFFARGLAAVRPQRPSSSWTYARAMMETLRQDLGTQGWQAASAEELLATLPVHDALQAWEVGDTVFDHLFFAGWGAPRAQWFGDSR